MSSQNEVATLAGGCFWCLEAVYDQMRGVVSVESGYMGGKVENPSYRAVCTGTTGHAEVIQITYDPTQVGFQDLLDVFFVIHDPTTLNRHGNDVGTQYRSAIYYHTPEQKEIADKAIAALNAEHRWNASIVTEVTPAEKFYIAEDYHQEYFANNGNQPYCQVVVAPKVAKFRKYYMEKLKA